MEKLLIFQLKLVIYMPKDIFCLIKTCALITNSLFYSVELGTFSPAVNTQSMPVKHGSNRINLWAPVRLFDRCGWKWLHSTDHCADIRGKSFHVLTEMGYLIVQKYILLD